MLHQTRPSHSEEYSVYIFLNLTFTVCLTNSEAGLFQLPQTLWFSHMNAAQMLWDTNLRPTAAVEICASFALSHLQYTRCRFISQISKLNML